VLLSAEGTIGRVIQAPDGTDGKILRLVPKK
jgi:hypothetical protein